MRSGEDQGPKMSATEYQYLPQFVKQYAGTFAIGVSTVGNDHERIDDDVRLAAIERLRPRLHRHETVALNPRGHIDVTLLGVTSLGPRSRMHSMTQALVHAPYSHAADFAHIDVGSAWTPLTGEARVDRRRLRDVDSQAEQSLRNRDLSLRPGLKADEKPHRLRTLTWLLIVLSFLLVFAVPLFIMHEAFEFGTDISSPLYFVVIAALALMAVMQIAEGIAAMRAKKGPPPTTAAAPHATALIAAYLPNEAGTIMSTLHAILGQKYSGGLQVILAYNTPTDLPVEADLRALEAKHPELLVMRVDGSTSKAANVNAALAAITGEFVGIFDADHQPMPGAFERAWQWISNGAGIVQGHCVIRNGDDSWVSRMIAIEFEQIYAVNHPGRAVMQGFGIFGGANGFWRTTDLRRVRFQSAYLTEDIDSSVRSVRLGIPIVNDPGLLSRELAPYDLPALWRQRMRWAQGWFQVSLRHGHAIVADKHLNPRQRFGLFMLLGWREAFPWVSALMWPILAFAVLRDGHLPSGVILLALITVATAISGPVQLFFAYRLAAPEIRQRRSWWWQYLAFSVLFYQEWKNLIVRVAHLRQALHQEEWVVTPRGHVEHAESTDTSSLTLPLGAQ
jgi:cellulose synthase/poly-beta-1,6-N-acetylglucosamine synthase-like glycosyltransferase